MTETTGSSGEGKLVGKQTAVTGADTNRTSASPSARWHLPSHLRLWMTAAVGLTADLWTKHWAFTSLDSDPQRDPLVIIPHIVTFRQSLNPGALFGMGKGLTALFIVASFLALGFVLFLFVHSSRHRCSLHWALGLVLAGALGNLYDRTHVIADVVKYTVGPRRVSYVGKVISSNEQGIVVGTWPKGEYPRLIPTSWSPEIRPQGVVRDFVKMEPKIRVGGWSLEVWPWVFNVADSMLVVGVGVLMLNFWWERRAESAAARRPAASMPPAST